MYPAEAAKLGQAPSGSSVASGTMTSNTVTFTGLSAGREYVAYALVSGQHRYSTVSNVSDEPNQFGVEARVDELEGRADSVERESGSVKVAYNIVADGTAEAATLQAHFDELDDYDTLVIPAGAGDLALERPVYTPSKRSLRIVWGPAVRLHSTFATFAADGVHNLDAVISTAAYALNFAVTDYEVVHEHLRLDGNELASVSTGDITTSSSTIANVTNAGQWTIGDKIVVEFAGTDLYAPLALATVTGTSPFTVSTSVIGTTRVGARLYRPSSVCTYGVMSKSFRGKFERCEISHFVEGGGYTAQAVDGTTSVTSLPEVKFTDQCLFHDNWRDGFVVRDSARFAVTDGLIDNSCHAFGNGRYGIRMDSNAGWDVQGHHYGNGPNGYTGGGDLFVSLLSGYFNVLCYFESKASILFNDVSASAFADVAGKMKGGLYANSSGSGAGTVIRLRHLEARNSNARVYVNHADVSIEDYGSVYQSLTPYQGNATGKISAFDSRSTQATGRRFNGAFIPPDLVTPPPTVRQEPQAFGGSLPDYTIGVEPFPFLFVNNGLTPTVAIIYYLTFIAPHDVTISQIAAATRATAAVYGAGGFARYGLCTVDSSNVRTLVARTATTTADFTSTFTNYKRAFDTTGGFPASYLLERGKKYSYALMFAATMTTMPQLQAFQGGPASGGVYRSFDPAQKSAGGQTDLLTSQPSITYDNSSAIPWLMGLV